MTKINDLISIFDNTPVEYQNLGKLAEIGTGSSNGNEAETSGCFPFFVRSKLVKYKNTYEYDEEAVIVPGEGGVGEIYHYIKGKYSLHQRAYRIHVLSDKLDTKFLYYYMSSHFKTYINSKAVFSTVKSLRKPMFLEFKIPLPPIETQREIVKILDVFKNMDAELEAELEARKKQYLYYKQKLLSFKDTIPRKKLGDVCTVRAGGTPSSSKAEFWENGSIPLLTPVVCQNKKEVGKIGSYITKKGLEMSSARMVGPGTTLLALVAASIGKVGYLTFDAAVNQNTAAIIPNDKISLDPEFVYYIVSSFYELFKNRSNGGMYTESVSFVRSLEIPVPQIETQREIVDILNRFDSLCNDLTAGLPAEIEARRKQYEYYRDKLLSWKTE